MQTMKCPVIASPQLKIISVQPTEQHTLVVRQGSRTAYLRFNTAVTVDEVRAYCEDQRNWKDLGSLSVIVDGHRFEPMGAGSILLKPSTAKVEFGDAPAKPSTIEFTRTLPGKG